MINKSNINVAFLRGVNVGGNNLISMNDLKLYFAELGYSNIKTFGNSGNIIFTSESKDVRKIEADIEKLIEKNLKISITVIARSFQEIQKLENLIPASWIKTPDKKYDVIFLHQSIDNPKIMNELGPNPQIEELIYYPGVLLWSIDRKDFSKSNLSKLVGSKLYKGMTIRTPGVVRKIYKIMEIQTFITIPIGQ